MEQKLHVELKLQFSFCDLNYFLFCFETTSNISFNCIDCSDLMTFCFDSSSSKSIVDSNGDLRLERPLVRSRARATGRHPPVARAVTLRGRDRWACRGLQGKLVTYWNIGSGEVSSRMYAICSSSSF